MMWSLSDYIWIITSDQILCIHTFMTYNRLFNWFWWAAWDNRNRKRWAVSLQVNSTNAMNEIASVIISLRLDVALHVCMFASVLHIRLTSVRQTCCCTSVKLEESVYLVVCVKEDHDSEQFGPKSAGFVGKVREKFVVLILLSQSLILLSVPVRSATGSLSLSARLCLFFSVGPGRRSALLAGAVWNRRDGDAFKSQNRQPKALCCWSSSLKWRSSSTPFDFYSLAIFK